MAQSTLIPSADFEIKIRYDRHGIEQSCRWNLILNLQSRLCPGFFNSYMPGTKRSLDTNFTGVSAKQISVYQSPVELDICLKEQELRGNSSITFITLDASH